MGSLEPDALRTLSEQFFALGCKLKCREEMRNAVVRQPFVNGGEMGARLVEPAGYAR